MATETPTVEREEINLNTAKGEARITAMAAYHNNLSKYLDACRLVKFLETLEKSPLRCGNYHIYVGSCRHSFIVKDRVIYGSACPPNLLSMKRIKEDEEYPSGILLTDVQSKHEKNKELRAFVLINADGGWENGPDVSLVDTLLAYKMPLVSFQCLAQFWNDSNETKLIKMLSTGILRLLDYTHEERIPFSKEEKKIFIKKDGEYKLKPPLGFVFMNNPNLGILCWHRSGTCLFHETKNNEYYLLGQDEGTYFGVQLPCAANTVKEAFEVLTPDIVKDKAGVKRQGEWFFLPVDEKEVPEPKNCTLQFKTEFGQIESVHLPLDNSRSNRHFVWTKDGRVGKDGQVFALDPKLEHSQHNDVSVKGWRVFVRNTAVRSVSQEGVD